MMVKIARKQPPGATCRVAVNERGQRIGQGHPQAKLSDAEVEQLLADRGPEHAPTMSYGQLALRYGISKASVRDFVKGRRRGQIGPTVDRKPPARPKGQTVRCKVSLSLQHRAKLHRLGGSEWLTRMLESV